MMKNHSRRSLLGASAILFAASRAVAGTGIFDAYITLNLGGGNVSYEFGSGFNFSPPTWTAANLGNFNATGSLVPGQLTLNGGKILTFKNNGGNVTGAEINYRFFPQGGTGGAFTQTGLFFDANLTNPGDQRWSASAANINVLLTNSTTARDAGVWNFDIFGKAFTSEGDKFTPGSGHTATFTVNASDFLWDGGGVDGNVSTANNWSNNIAPGAGHNLQFAGSTNTNVTSGLSTINRITFNSGAAEFTIGANVAPVSLANGIVNDSASLQRVTFNSLLSQPQTFDAGATAGGSLLMVSQIDSNGKALTVTGSNNTTFNGVLFGSGSLTKQGSGRLTVVGTTSTSYTGTTNITAGSFIMNGFASGGGDYTVASGATLGGQGIVQPASTKKITVAGTLSPGTTGGNSTANLSLSTSGTGGVTELQGGGSYKFEINSPSGSAGSQVGGWDLLTLSGVSVTASSGNKFVVKLTSLTAANAEGALAGWNANSGNQRFKIATFTGTGITQAILNSAFTIDTSQFLLANPGTYDNFYLETTSGSPNQVDLVYVPEPGSVGLIIGSSAVFLRRRRRMGA